MQKTPFVVAILVVILVRVVFWLCAGHTFEDAMITFRYAENIAGGRGFVYNQGEQVLGTTSPLWTVVLAAGKVSGLCDTITWARIFGILCDAVTCCIVMLVLQRQNIFAPVAFAVFFVVSHWIVPVTVSGMETSLLLCCMCLALLGWLQRSILFGIGLALTLLTRIDGVIFVAIMLGWGFTKDWRWCARQALVMLVLCLPWVLFAYMAFGNVVPQSLLAKRAVYHFPIALSSAPFLQVFTPVGEARPLLFAAKLLWSLFLFGSLGYAFRMEANLRPILVFFVVYTTAFMLSGTLVFSWYLVPSIFAAFIGVSAAVGDGCAALRRTWPRWGVRLSSFLLAGFMIVGLFVLVIRTDRASALQRYEEEVRRPAGKWLRENTPAGAIILLEPIGYIGYYAGPERRVWDEIGIVTPQIVPFRRTGAGWYTGALKALHPDFLVQYAAALRRNESEGDSQPLFGNDADRSWFYAHYSAVASFALHDDIPWMEAKEKEFVILKRR